jgi:hypothetical protein
MIPYMASPVTASSALESKWELSHVEHAVKSLAAFTVLLYALGLLTANQYLMGIGISDFSSLKPKFVLTGIWSFAFYLFSSSPIVIPMTYFLFSKKPLQGPLFPLYRSLSFWIRSRLPAECWVIYPVDRLGRASLIAGTKLHT